MFMSGQVFDSSVERRQPFSFRLGAGEVIPCWDQAVSQMKVGDEAEVICPYQLAYGERGAGGVIPPKANLKFEIKVLGQQ